MSISQDVENLSVTDMLTLQGLGCEISLNDDDNPCHVYFEGDLVNYALVADILSHY